MEVFSLLSYINKISLLAFFVTILVVAYQIYILKKEKAKEQTPSIPNFKDINKSNGIANYTNLPSFLLKKTISPVNYSKLVFLIILLLTIIVIFFIIIIIRRNNSSSSTETAVTQDITTPTKPVISPSILPTKILLLSPTEKVASPSPTEIAVLPSPSPTVTITPTEIILAQACTGQACLTPTEGAPTQKITTVQTLPVTGNFEKGLLIIGVAVSTIFFSFWF